MRIIALVATAAMFGAGCDDTGSVDGTRGECAVGGQGLGCDDEVVTSEDACWKLVQCGLIPLDDPEEGFRPEWGTCVDRIDGLDASGSRLAIACVAAASCDQLQVGGGPTDPYEFPDCLEVR